MGVAMMGDCPFKCKSSAASQQAQGGDCLQSPALETDDDEHQER